MSNSEDRAELLSSKTVIRTMDFEASMAFYTQVLGLAIEEEYSDGNGSKGLILRLGSDGSNALLEIAEIKAEHDYYQKAFSETLRNDKMDIQLRTSDVESWAKQLKDKWSARGPVLRPWGSRYLYLRDPDGLQIIIYEEKSSE